MFRHTTSLAQVYTQARELRDAGLRSIGLARSQQPCSDVSSRMGLAEQHDVKSKYQPLVSQDRPEVYFLM